MARRRKPPTDKQVEQSDKIFGLLFEEDELTWQNVIYDMINAEQMNPWDIDVSLIAKNFIKNLRKLKEMNFRISGKMVLAAALLLKIKSNRLLQEDITMLDNLLAGAEEPMDLLAELQDIAMGAEKAKEDLNKPKIYPRTPQPRKRKVSVYDLVEALEKALDVEDKRNRLLKNTVAPPEVPDKPKDITLVMKEVYEKVKVYFKKESTIKLTFEQLIPSDAKEDKVYTFIPLLHLDYARKIDIRQRKHFGLINIHLPKKKDFAELQTEAMDELATEN